MRFGIDMNTDHTLEEVGKQFDVTRERIRQIEAKALRKLRHPSPFRSLAIIPRRIILPKPLDFCLMQICYLLGRNSRLKVPENYS